MRFNIITNLNNGVGLEQDYLLLRRQLEHMGHQVTGVQFNNPAARAPSADVNIFLEVVVERFMWEANRQWLVPNPEWWFRDWDRLLPKFSLVWAKTAHACELFKSSSTRLLGWRSRDLYNPAIPRDNRVLHVAGKSQTKNTDAVVAAWKLAAGKWHLTIVSEHCSVRSSSGLDVFRRVSDDELRLLMNSHRFHLVPSGYEGWGHSLHEGLGVGAVVLTLAAPPMNELGSSVLMMNPDGQLPQNRAYLRRVSPSVVATATEAAIGLSTEELEKISAHAREQFRRECERFESNLADAVRAVS